MIPAATGLSLRNRRLVTVRRSLRDSNPEVLMGWAFLDTSISGEREVGAEVLTTT